MQESVIGSKVRNVDTAYAYMKSIEFIVGDALLFKLENLHSWTSYNIRFAASNAVGMSAWGGYLQITLPKPRPPDTPIPFINSKAVILSDEIIMLENQTLNVTWNSPNDNGAAIDYYEVEYEFLKTIQNTNQSEVNEFVYLNSENIFLKRLSVSQERIVTLKVPPLDCALKVFLRAHNKIGFSDPAKLLISTHCGELTNVKKNELFSHVFREKFCTIHGRCLDKCCNLITIIVCILIFILVSESIYNLHHYNFHRYFYYPS